MKTPVLVVGTKNTPKYNPKKSHTGQKFLRYSDLRLDYTQRRYRLMQDKNDKINWNFLYAFYVWSNVIFVPILVALAATFVEPVLFEDPVKSTSTTFVAMVAMLSVVCLYLASAAVLHGYTRRPSLFTKKQNRFKQTSEVSLGSCGKLARYQSYLPDCH